MPVDPVPASASLIAKVEFDFGEVEPVKEASDRFGCIWDGAVKAYLAVAGRIGNSDRDCFLMKRPMNFICVIVTLLVGDTDSAYAIHQPPKQGGNDDHWV